MENHDALKESGAAQDNGRDHPRLEAPQGQQSRANPEGSGQGVQRGGSGEEVPQEVACAYAVTVDGFISVARKAVRNAESPFVVWMSKATWDRLAICATTQGQFYSPCTPDLHECSQLRRLVNAEEIADAR